MHDHPRRSKDYHSDRVGISSQHPDFFKTFVAFDGLVIEGCGDGNVPNNLIKALAPFARRKVLVLVSQCTYGSTHHRYEGGKALIEAGALTAGNMTICGRPAHPGLTPIRPRPDRSSVGISYGA
jgi:L-asparaginase/Glu-tRNA(Gln) amidotransferase subunit D